MQYIFDQQTGRLAAFGLMLDCVFSLLRQWTLRPHLGIDLAATPLQGPMSHDIPGFESLDMFQPRASAMIHGALLSLILLYTMIVAVPHSWIHVLNLHIPEAGNPTQNLNRHAKKSSAHLQVDITPTEADDLQSKAIASSSPRTAAALVPPRRVTILLDPYVGKYISRHPPAKISIQIEGDYFGEHLSLSMAAAGHLSLAPSPMSQGIFVIVGVENSYVDFTANAQGRIDSLSLVLNGKVIAAQRQ
jgi:hypothetical protein